MFNFIVAYGRNVFTVAVNAFDMDDAFDRIKKIAPGATYKPYTPGNKLGDVAYIK